MAGKFELYKDKAEEYRFRLRAGTAKLSLSVKVISRKPAPKMALTL